MSAQRLYMAAWEYDVNGDRDTSGVVWDRESREPVGWEEYSFERWGADVREEETGVWSHRPFHWPRTDKVFLSRSSAQHRVDIINAWGGRAVLVECTPEWETVAFANKRRANYRLMNRVAKKRAELAALEAQVK